jgi:hypothetical protein
MVARALLDAGERALASDDVDAATARLAALPLLRGACVAALHELGRSTAPATPPELAEAPREWLVEAAGDEARLEAVAALLGRSEDDLGLGAAPLTDPGASPARDALDDLRLIARRLVRAAEATQSAVTQVALQRAFRPLVVLAVAIAVGFALTGTVRWLRTPHDLARGARWRTSSALDGWVSTGTIGEVQPPNLVFHTLEEHEPWVEIDLGGWRTVRAARIVARDDCCRDRTFPLVIEVSGDQTNFQAVALQDHEFRVWKPSFAPKRARFVRLRQLNDKAFHLTAISIY